MLVLTLLPTGAPGQPLRVATVNVWSGLDYQGTWTIGSFESPDEHERRVGRLIAGLREAAPDVLVLQEVNPVDALSQRIGAELGYDVVTQRVLAGIKAGPIGIPWNLNEGLAILARPWLELEFVDVIPLNPSFGAFGNVLSLHTTEQNAALIGSVRSPNGERILIVTIHLPASVPDMPSTRDRLNELCRRRGMSDSDIREWVSRMEHLDTERSRMLDRVLDELHDRFPGIPAILLGDLNLPADAPDIARLSSHPELTHVVDMSSDPIVTWDPVTNPLTRRSSSPTRDSGTRTPLEELSDLLDLQQSALDHIFVRHPIRQEDIVSVGPILTPAADGGVASDHYGLMTTIDISSIRAAGHTDISDIEGLPIISYDTDVGFGYGVKIFLLDQLSLRESFDAIAFNSTQGERWYRLVFSLPDVEIRQGTIYPVALDVTLDYDRFLANPFFGIGPRTVAAGREEHRKELFESQVLFSRGMTRQTVIQGGLRYRWIRNSGFSPGSVVGFVGAPLSTGAADAVSLQLSMRHDTRNSYINPSRGVVLQADAEYAPDVGMVSFIQAGLTAQYYATLMYPKTVLATRLSGQSVSGSDIPVQFLLPLGGNRSLRGFPEGRLLGTTTVVATVELRFPIIWRFGGIAGFDTGNVWMSPGDAGFAHWKSSTAVGIRFYMDTFVVRADLGFSQETTGFYLNFGHIF